jgi:CubicO group peptidase (beta-lactamase class C family)
VLGKLIERASGVPYQTYVETRVVAPVRIRGRLGFTIPDLSQHATGYHPRWSLSHLLIRRLIGDSLMRPVSHDRSLVSFAPIYVNGAAYGGIVANSTGLREYLQAMLRGELSIFDLLRRALAARPQGVIMGWFIGAMGGEPYLRHAGGGGGYYSEVRLYPNLGLGSVVVSNFSGFSDRRLLDRLDNVAISAVR